MSTKDKKEYRLLSQLRAWDRNPRDIDEDDFLRLKDQIVELGEYKPLIITSDGVVLGGNMRLRAYRELGYTQCWVSVVDATTDAQKLKYALSDNDSAGHYIEDQLRDLIKEVEEDIDLDALNVDMGADNKSLRDFLAESQIITNPSATTPVSTGAENGVNYQSQFQVVVTCVDETEQERVYNQLSQLGLQCKVLTL